MKLFLLPGSDPINKEWIERVQPLLGQFVDSTQIQQYRHWKDASPMSLNHEVSTFIDTLENNQEPYAVFAKSAGILIALEALAESAEPPVFAIFAGFPLNAAEQHEMDLAELFGTIDYPVLFIQNAYDPAGSAEELRRMTNRLEHVDFLLLPGNSHEYPVMGNTLEAIEDFIGEYR